MSYKERDMYQPLALFIKNDDYFNAYTKITDNFKSRSSDKEIKDGILLTPDCAAVYYPFNEYPKTASFQRINNDLKIKLFSFEVKKEPTSSDWRDHYLQAVSNSSWANEGYLVYNKEKYIPEKYDKEFKRLNDAHGIGLILLDIQSPLNSIIKFRADYKEKLNYKTMEKMCEINPDFNNFLRLIENHLSMLNYDTESMKNLYNQFDIPNESYFETEEYKNKFNININNDNSDVEKQIKSDLKDDEINNFLSSKTIKFINGDEIKSDSWKYLFINFIKYLLKDENYKYRLLDLKNENAQYYKIYFTRKVKPLIISTLNLEQEHLYTKIEENSYIYSTMSADYAKKLIKTITEYLKLDIDNSKD